MRSGRSMPSDRRPRREPPQQPSRPAPQSAARADPAPRHPTSARGVPAARLGRAGWRTRSNWGCRCCDSASGRIFPPTICWGSCEVCRPIRRPSAARRRPADRDDGGAHNAVVGVAPPLLTHFRGDSLLERERITRFDTLKAARDAGLHTFDEWVRRTPRSGEPARNGIIPRRDAMPVIVKGQAFFGPDQCEELVCKTEAKRRKLLIPIGTESIPKMLQFGYIVKCYRISDCRQA